MQRALFFLGVLAGLAAPRRASACGGCFHQEDPVVTTGTATGRKTAQVVTDHRMVLAMSSTRTTLWDQIRYSGEPDDFIWVLPVPHGVALDLGLGDNAFVDAVDRIGVPTLQASATRTCTRTGTSSTSTVAPTPYDPPPRGTMAGGCGGGGAPSIDYDPGSRGGGTTPGTTSDGGTDARDYRGSESVMVGAMDAAVVGPYAIERVSNAPPDEGFVRWAARNRYGIPDETMGAVRHYVDLSMDFLVVRLRPEAGVQQMQPIRISYPGYRPTLPLRMISAGVADTVGLTLMVIADSPVEARGFFNVEIPISQLVWDFATQTSNYRDVFRDTVRAGGTWVIESLQHVTPPMMSMTPSAAPDDGGAFDVTPDEPPPAMNGGDDAGPTLDRADPYVDRRIAFDGMSNSPLLTRLRTELGRRELDRDLELDAAQRAPRPPTRYLVNFANVPPCPAMRTSTADAGTFTAPSPPYTPDATSSGSSSRCGFCAASPRRTAWGRWSAPGYLVVVGATLAWRRRRRAARRLD